MPRLCPVRHAVKGSQGDVSIADRRSIPFPDAPSDGVVVDHLMDDRVISAPYDVIGSVIEYIQSKYGTVEAYVQSIGITYDELAAIRTNIRPL